MDPVSLLFLVATIWFFRNLAEDTYAGIRGHESPRIARQRARQQLAQQRAAATGGRTIGRAVAGRIANRIADPRSIGPARRYLAGLWEDSWEDAHTRREERRRHRAEREREKAEREATGQPDPDNASRTRWCRDCKVILVVEPEELCISCERAQRPADEPSSPPQPERQPEPEPEPEPRFNGLHYCVGGCGRPIPDPRGDLLNSWCGDCRFYVGNFCGAGCGRKVGSFSGQLCDTCVYQTSSDLMCVAGCGRSVPMPGRRCHTCAPDRCATCYRRRSAAGPFDEFGECPACQRDTKQELDGPDRLDDPQVEDLNDDQPVETPEPNPAPDTTREDTPPVTTSIDGDVTSPLTALAFATSCLQTNTDVMNEVDAMANNVAGEGVGDGFVAIIRDVWAAGDQFGAGTEGAREEFARHVAIQAEIGGNPDLAKTVQGTYLDTDNA